MIKPFRLNKNKSSNNRPGDRFDFNFSNIQALQVPKGWDKLIVSIISAETGKPTSKTGKASAKHGNCRWTETLSESVWISFDETSVELDQCLSKLVISSGSSKSNILGEATVDLAGYATSKSSSIVALPLEKCKHGTILQVEIQCLTPKTLSRNEKQSTKDANANYDDVDCRSDISRAGELGSRQTSFSVSGSRPSADSMDSSGQGSFSSQSGTTSMDEIRAEAKMWERNARKLETERDELKHEIEQLHVLLNESKSKQKDYQNDAGDIVKELERENEILGQQLKKAQESNSELTSSLQTERDELEQEIKQLKVLLEESKAKQKDDDEDLVKELERENEILGQQLQKAQESNIELVSCLQTERDELEQEIRRLQGLLDEANEKQNEENDNIVKELQRECDMLSQQLQKAQNSNAGLVSCVQELEETVVSQEKEIGSLLQSKSEDDLNRGNKGNLESKCEELEQQLQGFKTLSEEQEAEIVALLQLIENKKAESSANPTEEEKVKKDLADEDNTEGDHLKNNIGCSRCRGLESLNLQSMVDELKANLFAKEKEVEFLKEQVSDLEKIEETIEVIQREGEAVMEKNLELESCKNELEQKLSKLEEENVRLQSQLKTLTVSKELRSLPSSVNLKDETRRLHDEMEAQREYMRNKLEEMQNRWLEAQQECERLKNSESNVGSEVFPTNDGELKKELKQIKRKNAELQKKIKSLEEKKELKNVVQSPEKVEPNCIQGKPVKEADSVSRIQVLEDELAEALEANDIYKKQLRLMTEEQNTKNIRGHTEEKTPTELEAELNDLRERYLQMSIKYAEVEEQREDLVIKLKSIHEGGRVRKWF